MLYSNFQTLYSVHQDKIYFWGGWFILSIFYFLNMEQYLDFIHAVSSVEAADAHQGSFNVPGCGISC